MIRGQLGSPDNDQQKQNRRQYTTQKLNLKLRLFLKVCTIATAILEAVIVFYVVKSL